MKVDRAEQRQYEAYSEAEMPAIDREISVTRSNRDEEVHHMVAIALLQVLPRVRRKVS